MPEELHRRNKFSHFGNNYVLPLVRAKFLGQYEQSDGKDLVSPPIIFRLQFMQVNSYRASTSIYDDLRRNLIHSRHELGKGSHLECLQ